MEKAEQKRNKKRILITISVILLAITIYGLLLHEKHQRQESLRRQVLLPDPTLYDRNRAEAEKLLERIDNGEVELAWSKIPKEFYADNDIPDYGPEDVSYEEETEEVEVDIDFEIPEVTVTETSYSSCLIHPAKYTATVSSTRKLASRKYGGKPSRCYRSTKIYYRRLPNYNTERYQHYQTNTWQSPQANPLTTVSFNVDTASFTNCRRFLEAGKLPPIAAVRVEDFINYLNYDYPSPKPNQTFATIAELGPCPWNENNKLLQLGFKAKTIPSNKQQASNLVFLIDVSGSMSDENKLPLLKRSLLALANHLKSGDTISLVTYSSTIETVLNGITSENKELLQEGISNLESGGGTNGAGGLQMAYDLAQKHFIKNGNNRVILATDGDFNIGMSSDDDLSDLIKEKRKTNIFLSVIGVGEGNLNDSMMKKLSDAGNGNYHYIDTFSEAKKVFIKDLAKNTQIIAKDAKIQLEFNPKYVNGYKLIGYASRVLQAKDFDNDKKNAGDIGAGHTVTFLYELKLNRHPNHPHSAKLRYQQKVLTAQAKTDELVQVKIRYKKPTASKSTLETWQLAYSKLLTTPPSENFFNAVTVASLGLSLKRRNSIPKLHFSSVLEFLELNQTCAPSLDRLKLLDLYENASLIIESNSQDVVKNNH